ncbi:hypothetical protein H6F67_26250 [Microcoleus sp. FACHB-1515]|uniref:hypothetical protein n=1 Tax=Cyanophyceae TaxID=3028117 RepID=UPI001687EC27|nr:hypothetical protein [Microcoleus sp. FACHB-1515]MBD2093351.1 hypothetical protein [Microcoleus sp. FACHB-1515]
MYISIMKEAVKMAIFDQRGQHVNYQYNAAGNINIGSVQNQMQLVDELEKLKSELSKASEAEVIDAEVFTDADYQMSKAIQQSKKPNPDKKSVIEHLKNAKSLLEDVTAVGGLVTALNEVIQLIVNLL